MDTHPGLLFLKEATEFHSRYVHTVSGFIYHLPMKFTLYHHLPHFPQKVLNQHSEFLSGGHLVDHLSMSLVPSFQSRSMCILYIFRETLPNSPSVSFYDQFSLVAITSSECYQVLGIELGLFLLFWLNPRQYCFLLSNASSMLVTAERRQGLVSRIRSLSLSSSGLRCT